MRIYVREKSKSRNSKNSNGLTNKQHSGGAGKREWRTQRVEFFKYVRARYYVLSELEPNEHTLNGLCEGKEKWEEKQLSVALFPTYESKALKEWLIENQDRIRRLKIDIKPASQHTNRIIDDNPNLICQAHKLEF